MAGSVATTSSQVNIQADRPIRKYILDWVADASGDVSGNWTTYISGLITRIVINPGSPAPTANYDMTLLDENGVDLLAGQGANLHTSNTTHIMPGLALYDGVTTSVAPITIDDKLNLVIANAGNLGAGQVVIYVR